MKASDVRAAAALIRNEEKLDQLYHAFVKAELEGNSYYDAATRLADGVVESLKNNGYEVKMSRGCHNIMW